MRRALLILSVCSALCLLTGGCEPYPLQMMALAPYEGHGPPAAFDYTPISFTNHYDGERNHKLNDHSFGFASCVLATMPDLDVDFGNSDLTNASVPLMQKLDLCRVQVVGTDITAPALMQLRDKKKLQALQFSKGSATPQQIEALQSALKLPCRSDEKDGSVYLSTEPLRGGNPTTSP